MMGIRTAIVRNGRVYREACGKSAMPFLSFASTLTVFSILLGIKWVALIYVLYYTIMCKKIVLHYQANEHNARVVSRLKGLEKVFYPHILWMLPQVQTVSYFVRRMKQMNCQEKEIEQDDGGSFFLDIYEPKHAFADGTGSTLEPKHTVIVVHGLGGSGNSKHVTFLSSHFLKSGYRAIAFNARGAKGTLKTPTFFHIGWTKDLVRAVKYALSEYEGTVSVVGFSLGGHWITKMFGELEDEFSPAEVARICGGMVISIPFDFLKIAEYMARPIPRRFYGRGFAVKLHNFVRRNREVFSRNGFDVDMLLRCRTLQEMDLHLTKRVFNIKDLNRYYHDQSCVNVIPRIKKPFLILNSKDDPIVPYFTIPIETCSKSSHVILALTERGGHMGFLGYNNYMTYSEEAAVEFITTIVQLHESDSK